MGRVSRYKKIKACDPFSKRYKASTDTDTTHDLPPDDVNDKKGKQKRKRVLDWDNEADRETLLQIDAKKMLKAAHFEQQDTSSKQNMKLESKRPDETMKDFMKRIRLETRKTLAENTKKISSTAQKRKIHLKEKKKAKKLKGRKAVAIDNELNPTTSASIIRAAAYQHHDHDAHDDAHHDGYDDKKQDMIRFGEVAHRPPDLSAFKVNMDKAKVKSLKKSYERQQHDDAHHHDAHDMMMKMKKRSLDMIIGDGSDEYTTPAQARQHAVNSSSSISSLSIEERDRLRLQAQAAYKVVKAKRLAAAQSHDKL